MISTYCAADGADGRNRGIHQKETIWKEREGEVIMRLESKEKGLVGHWSTEACVIEIHYEGRYERTEFSVKTARFFKQNSKNSLCK